MPDIYAAITEVDRETQGRLAELIEARAADPRQRAMLEAYLTELEFPPAAHVLEIGCATGAVTRALARWPGVARAVGVDPSEVFLARARSLASDLPQLSFLQGDGRRLPLDPLEDCIRAFRENYVHDPWLVRRLPRLLDAAGFEPRPMRSHGYVEAAVAGYMLTCIARGADVLLRAGRIGADSARAFEAEAQRRSQAGTWFGHIAYASILARKR